MERRIIKKEKYKSPFVSISFISKKIAEILEYYGANLRTSKGPSPKNGVSDYKHFWIGYICGHGSLGAYKSSRGKYTTFSPSIRIVGSLDLCYAFYDYCSKITSESKARPRKYKSTYGIVYSSMPAIKLMKHFFDSEEYGLTRKIKLAKQIIEKHSDTINSLRPRTENEKIEIHRLYSFNGWSIRKISSELKIDINIINKTLKESGIKISN